MLGGLAAVVAGLLLATGLPISSATTQDAYRGVDRVVLDLGASGGVEVTSRSRVGRRR